MPNRLANETSPYLVQHANNPVDWYPWGEEALQRAREEDKPIFLSIGYSACHWCHVMERESFENDEIASVMNEHFVNIKVDREERPDLDSIYMGAVQAMTGRGGWPMSMFLTPEGEPFYGGTYFPPEDRHGMAGFPRVLMALAEAYRDRRPDITRSADEITAAIRKSAGAAQSMEPLAREVLNAAYRGLRSNYDPEHGGLGTAPKFPQPMVLEFLLRYHLLTGQSQSLSMVETTLERMARGGIYDQLGGGFHRYSTDPYWLVPHFEKMLYDNALLSRLYLHAYQATGNPLYRAVAEETLDYVLREMTHPDGGFYSSQDADSEGEEGKFFVWTPREMEAVLGRRDSPILQGYYGVTHEGNFEGRNILHAPRSAAEVAQEQGRTEEAIWESVERGKPLLLEARSQRIPPATDDKVLTSWNGLMLHGFALGAAVLGREDYLQAATANADFILANMRDEGRLLRTYREGEAKLKAYLEDYAHFIDGLLALYEATFDSRWLNEADALARQMIELFWDEADGIFYDTGSDHETLIVRPRDFSDNAVPCGSSAAAEVLLRLNIFMDEPDFGRKAVSALRSVKEYMTRVPEGFGHWLGALDFYLASPREIAIVGPVEVAGTRALLDTVHGRYLPNKVVMGMDPDSDGFERDLPLLEDKEMLAGMPTAYVCQNYACQLPVTEPDALAAQLEGSGETGLGPLTVLS